MNWFKEQTGSYPIHVDGHQHVQVLPQITMLLSNLLKEFNVRSFRLPREVIDFTKIDWIHEETRRDFYTSVISQSLQTQNQFFDNQLKTTNYFVGMPYMGSNGSVGLILFFSKLFYSKIFLFFSILLNKYLNFFFKITLFKRKNTKSY